MQESFALPAKGKNDDIIRLTNNLESTAKARRRSLRIGWRHDLAWLKGIRAFRVDYSTGEVSATYQNYKGELKLRYEDVLVKRQRECGLLMRTDVRPSVRRKGIGLDALRKAAVGQVTLDQFTSNIPLEPVKEAFVEDLVDFGIAGLGVWVQKSIHLGNNPVVERIPGWELLPLPVDPTRGADVKGIIRDRWVTYDWVKGKESLKFPKADMSAALGIRYVLPGNRLPGDADPNPSSTGEGGGGTKEPFVAQRDNADPRKHHTPMVYLREYWVETEPGRCGRYIVKIGDWVALDLDESDLITDGELPIMPIAVAQYFRTGFYGRSFISPLIPINKQQEKLAGNLFQNIIDLDLLGERWIPTTSGINRQRLVNQGRNKYQFYEPDYLAWQVRPFQLLPQNMGDMPGKVLEASHGMIDRLSRESDIWSGRMPGRTDSARAVGLLYETASIPLIPVTAAIAKAFSQMYAAMLQEAGNIFRQGDGGNYQAIKLSGLDDAIVGVVFDPTTGTVQLGQDNPIPKPHEVIIDIAERMPKLANQRQMEVDEALQAGKMDLVDYTAICLKQNLDVPLGNRGLVESLRTCWLENMVLFGDGKSPGTIEANDVSDDHRIHMRIHGDFMKSPEWKLASPEVKTKFIIHFNWHRSNLGQWAELLPTPEALSQLPPEVAQQMMASAPQGAAAAGVTGPQGSVAGPTPM